MGESPWKFESSRPHQSFALWPPTHDFRPFHPARGRRYRTGGGRGNDDGRRGGAAGRRHDGSVDRLAVAGPAAAAGRPGPGARGSRAHSRRHGRADRAFGARHDDPRGQSHHRRQCRGARGAGAAHYRAGRAGRIPPSGGSRPAGPAGRRQRDDPGTDRPAKQLADEPPAVRRPLRTGRAHQPHRRDRRQPRAHRFRRQRQPRAAHPAGVDHRLCRDPARPARHDRRPSKTSAFSPWCCARRGGCRISSPTSCRCRRSRPRSTISRASRSIWCSLPPAPPATAPGRSGWSGSQVLGQSAPLIVRGDEKQLEQLVRNLVDNALKYGAPDTRRDDGRRKRRPGDGGVTVRDRGEGIAAEHIPHLTRRFYRVDPGRSRAAGGTGLGLAIVKHIVERHRGRLDIASRPGDGHDRYGALAAGDLKRPHDCGVVRTLLSSNCNIGAVARLPAKGNPMTTKRTDLARPARHRRAFGLRRRHQRRHPRFGSRGRLVDRLSVRQGWWRRTSPARTPTFDVADHRIDRHRRRHRAVLPGRRRRARPTSPTPRAG